MLSEAEVKALSQALAIEEEGLSFYHQAADRVADATTRATFSDLARDEEDHRRMVQAQYQALAQGRGWLPVPRAVEPADLDKPLFPKGREGLEKAIRRDTAELEALWFGLDIENRSFEPYTRLARENPAGRQMYDYLAQAERTHFNILMMRYEAALGRSPGWQG